MEKVVHNIFRAITYLLIALGVVFIAIVWIKGDTALENDLSLQDRIMNPFTWTTYIALGIALILSVFFPIVQVVTNPKNAVRALIALGILVVIGLIAFGLASGSLEGDVLQKAFRKGELTEAGSRRVGAALIGTYILGILAVLTVIYSAIASIFKK